MGTLEIVSRKRRKKANIQKIILNTVAAAGLLSVAILVPNALQTIDMFYGDKDNRRRQWQKAVTNSRKKMLNSGLLKKENGFYSLTEEGKKKLRHAALNDFKFKKPKKWDQKWRMLIFDIREDKRGLRDKVRVTLERIGFKRLQYSVWIYPYDCEDLINLLKADFQIGKEVLYVVVDVIENDEVLKKDFGLLSKKRNDNFIENLVFGKK